jgi:hypothetical protein
MKEGINPKIPKGISSHPKIKGKISPPAIKK